MKKIYYMLLSILFTANIFAQTSGVISNQDLRKIGSSHITQDAGVGGNGTSGGFGIKNIFIGEKSGFSNGTGYENTSIGFQTLYFNTTGKYNSAVGNFSLFSNTTGYYNNAFGALALYNNTTGNYNTAIGFHSLVNTRTGNYNTSIGDSAGYDLTTGNNNIFVGRNTTANVGSTADNQLNIGNWIYGNNGRIGIGAGVTATNPTRAQLVVNGFVANNNGTYGFLNGSATTGTISARTVNTSIWASDRIVANEFNATSDMRIKRNIKPLENNSLAKLANIKVVSYTKLSKNGSTNEIGVLGQEIEKILPDAVKTSEGDIYNDSTKTWEVVQDFRTVNYQSIGLLTTKAVQELNTQVQQQQAMIEALKKDNEELKVILKKMIERK